jgi:photosystem II stability/assembly factor-like uncharacterized protein
MKNLNYFLLLLPLIVACNKEHNTNTPTNNSLWSEKVVSADFAWQGIAVADSQTAYVYGSKGNNITLENAFKLIRTTDGGNHWTEVYNISNGSWGSLLFSDANKGFITGYQTLYKSVDAGNSWDATYLGVNNFYSIYQVNSHYLLGYGAIGFYQSNDTGNTWQLNSNINNIHGMDFIDSLTGFCSGTQGIFKTVDGGITWSQYSSYIANFGYLDYLDANNAIALTAEESSPHAAPTVYFNKTTDGGISWTKMNMKDLFNINLVSTSCVLFDRIDKIYLGGVEGIYSSSDFGNSWVQEYSNSSLGYVWIEDIKKMNNKIIAIANFGGLILTK